MATATKKATEPRMTDEAVKAKTGRNWKEWFAILDAAGATRMKHPEIVKYLHTKQDVGPWWQQMVTVTYEQARGLREVHQKPEGYEISVSRTIKAPVGRLFKSIAGEKTRLTWLPETGLTVRNSTPNKTIRFDWVDAKSRVEFSLLSKADDKTQVVVTHRKLPDAKASAKMKTYWGQALDRLRESQEA